MATIHMTGGITEVKDAQNSNEIKELASFAVDEHNKKELKFKKVVCALQQVVAAIKYYITLEAADGDLLKVYEAKVWVKTWENFKELLEFKFVGLLNSSATT